MPQPHDLAGIDAKPPFHSHLQALIVQANGGAPVQPPQRLQTKLLSTSQTSGMHAHEGFSPTCRPCWCALRPLGCPSGPACGGGTPVCRDARACTDTLSCALTCALTRKHPSCPVGSARQTWGLQDHLRATNILSCVRDSALTCKRSSFPVGYAHKSGGCRIT